MQDKAKDEIFTFKNTAGDQFRAEMLGNASNCITVRKVHDQDMLVIYFGQHPVFGLCADDAARLAQTILRAVELVRNEKAD